MTTPEFFTLQAAVAGRYSLVREIGRGGMGIVFLARDVALERAVALKLLPPALAGDAAQRRRFLREARTAASLSHPHIVPIHSVEEAGDLVYLVMAFVEGETLGERVRRAGPLPVREAIQVLREVAWALGHAHARGIVHRDIKPDNILLDHETGRALVTDFGIAAAPAMETPPEGTAVGTPAYMSPEQADGGEPDARADLYSLGVTAWFALTGRLPYDGGSRLALMHQHASAPVPGLLAVAPRVPARLAALIERTLAKEPADRPRDAAELSAGLDAVRGAAAPAIPAPLRAFLREADAARREMGVMATTMLASGGIALTLRLFASGINQSILSSVFWLAMVLAGAGGAVRFGQVLGAARLLRRQGYDHPAVSRAAAAARAEQEEEWQLAQVGSRRTRFEGAGLVAAGLAKSTALIAIVLNGWGPGWFEALAIVGAVVVPTVTLRKLWSMIRPARGGWLSALAGRAGKALLGLAGVGLGRTAQAPPLDAADHTVIAIGADAMALFDALPETDRARLAELRPAIARLVADARLLRGAGDAPGAPERLATVAAALEALRLDLLRVRAGALSALDLTGPVEAVTRLHDELLLREGAERSVERLLSRPDPTPT